MDSRSPHRDAPVPASLARAWSGVASTKFRPPRLRRDVIEREALLHGVRAMALERRLTLVCAPAGFGKSTLLAQLCANLGDAADAVWLSLDADDNDANRLFLSMLGALRGVALEWDVEPAALAAQLDGAGPGSRAAVAGLINALCSYEGARLLLIVDDLHRVGDAGAMQLLDDILNRLPPEIGFVVGSRTEPALSLARWRASRELGELRMADLQFGEADTQALALARGVPLPAPDFARDALALSQGWAAGLQLIVGSATGPGVGGPSLQGARTRRHLFDYFAQEVLAELPPDLRDFVLQSSILPELTPALCNAVTGRSDAHDILETLYRRNLFLTTLDETLPTLRFHDLFRDFLGAELERRTPQDVAELHARAALSEAIPRRAVMHWLLARRWDDALAAILLCADALLAEGGFATIERWLDQLPSGVRQSRPEVAHLLGLCAWSRWDWLAVRSNLERACEGYRSAGRQPEYVGALGVLGGCYNGMGELDAAARVLEEADRLDLDVRARVPFDSLHAWLAFARGRVDDAVVWLHTMADHVVQEPSTIYPNAIDTAHGHCAGLPGALPALRALQSLCRDLRRHEVTHWSSAVVAQGAWLEFWQGHREAAVTALDEQRRLQQRLPGALMLMMSSLHLHAFHLALQGAHVGAVRNLHGVLQMLEVPEARGQKASWGRSYLHALARVLWIAQDAEGLQPLLPALLAPRSATEWPVHDMGRALVRGQYAMLTGDGLQAESALVEAVALHQHLRLPSFMGDPRISLALLRRDRGDSASAWACFAPVLEDALRDDAIGSLLLEPPAPLQRLLAGLPADQCLRPELQALLRRLAVWHAPRAASASTSPVDAEFWLGVTEREREVLALLASGLSNKLIARRMDLSLHTVKRHVANVLGKLGVDSRVEAATWYRARA